MARAQVARAAGVSPEAVSNWVRRHPDFPLLTRLGRQTGYPVTAVATWLDTRKIHGDDLLPGEQQGRTYGHRFREATGLAAATPPPERLDGSMTDRLEKSLWTPLVRLGKGSSDPDVFQATVMSLLCLRGADPVAWSRIVEPPADTVHDVIGEVLRRQPDGLAKAVDALRHVPNDAWWQHRLVKIIGILTNRVSAGAESAVAGRIPAADAFDYLLDRFAKERRRSQDQFLTPAALARLMVRLADPGPADRVHDPCCSSGELLVAALAHVRYKGATGPTPSISGRAISLRTWRLAAMNVAVHDGRVDLADIPPGSFHEIDAGPGGYDVILMNPPFNMADWQLPADGRQHRWPYGEPPPHNANFAWLQLAAEALAPAGRAVVMMPESAADNANPRDRDIRGSMVENGVVRCVIAFPKQLFRETTTAVTLWVLGRPSEQRQDVLLMDATQARAAAPRRAAAAAPRKDRTYRTLTGEGCQTIVDVYRGWLDYSTDLPVTANGVRAVCTTLDEIRQRNYDLHPAAYVHRQVAGTPEAASSRSLLQLRDELGHLDSRAKEIDLALDHYLDRMLPWSH